MTRILLTLTTSLVLLASAAAADPAASKQATAPAAKVTRTPASSGAIRGTVLFEGEAPDRPLLERDSDPYCQKTPRLAEDVVVTKGKLKDVLVRIKTGTLPALQAAPPASPSTPGPALLVQKECMYSPRVQGLVVGQTLAVRNSDGTFHNVRGTVAGKPLWNQPQPAKAKDLALAVPPTPGDVIEVQCDVHPWMHAYAVVQDSPYFAVTGTDGVFAITGLPPGTYTLEAWHPTLGSKSMTVKVGTGKKGAVTARFSYKATE